MSEHPRARETLVTLGAGLAAAGLGAVLGVAAERLAMGRPLLPFGTVDGVDSEDYGDLHTKATMVTADDGTLLHVEVEEIGAALSVRGARQTPVTVVLCHGYALSMDSWHFQRKALRGRYRLVCWDHRGHGRSGSGPAGSATIDQVGADLAAVLDAVAPTGPLVLIGHSMGGMTIMSLGRAASRTVHRPGPGRRDGFNECGQAWAASTSGSLASAVRSSVSRRVRSGYWRAPHGWSSGPAGSAAIWRRCSCGTTPTALRSRQSCCASPRP